MPKLPKRKPCRLKRFDYGTPGTYFVTVCTHNRMRLLSEITVGQGLAPAENRLKLYGKIASEELKRLEEKYSNITVEKFVIMPNHIHLLVVISEAAGVNPCPTLSDFICAYKSLTTKKCKEAKPIAKIFQNSFYDHIIRNENDYLEIWNYIDTNPKKWGEDRFYSFE